ncbi:MAG TPA: hypothetical protein VGN51_21555 [Acidimicrobiia bacterium]
MTASGPSVALRARALVAALVAVLVWAFATVAPAASAKTAAKSTTTTVATAAKVPTKWDPRLQPIADKVAELRKLEFEHPVAAEFLDDAAFEKKVTSDRGKLSAQDKRDLERSQAQLRAVGLIGADIDLFDAVGSLQTSGVLAYYDPKTKRITVKGTSLDDVSTRVTVAHELTHALQDQHFDLEKLEKAAEADHGSTVLHTIAEGDAVRIEDDYVKTLSDADQQAYTTQNAQISQQAQTEITAKGVPDSLSVVFQAPYVLGPSMLDAVIAKEQDKGVDALFEHPPTADAAFVTPSTLVDHRTFQTVPTPKLQAGERRVGKPDVFGALSLFQVLSSRVDNATALSAADAWDGDAMITFTRNDQTCLRATFAGRGTAGTPTITDALQQWATQMPGGSATVEGAGDRVTLTACDPGSAATAIPNQPLASLVYVASRDGLFSELLKSGFTTQEATCSADTVVRDPVFAPVIEAAGNDPSAEPDPALVTAVQQRVREIVAGCRQT